MALRFLERELRRELAQLGYGDWQDSAAAQWVARGSV